MARGTPRDLKKEEFWRRRLGAQAGSGLSVRAWCRRHGVRESAFYWWRTRLARRDAAAPCGSVHVPPPLVPVQVMADTAPAAAQRIEIVLPGARCVHVFGRVERQMLAEVVAVLATSAPAAEASGC